MEELVTEKAFKHANVHSVAGMPHVVVVEATAAYIPLEPFKEIFNFVGDIVHQRNIVKLIFDKRKLSVFHQPSMEWYFIDWKERMYDSGLTVHRKILPSDDVFRQSVRIGRDKISKAYPEKKFNKMDIQYSESLEQALLN